MKAEKLIHAIEELVRLADKEAYYRDDNLQLRFSLDDSSYVIGTREDGVVYLSVYFGFEIGFKFYLEKNGFVLLDQGSTENLIEYSGPGQVLSMIDNAGEALLTLGRAAIESGDYEFKTMERLSEEFMKIREWDKKDEGEKH